ncbi:hypothetical protein JCM10207_004212 [Rhodosporidiobolus poonsookiae]
MPSKNPKVNYGARKRTSTLPIAMRKELEQLGHIQPQNNQRMGRKEKRKQERNQAKQNRAAHQQQQNAKRKLPEDDQDDHLPVASTSKVKLDADQPSKKRAKVAQAGAEGATETGQGEPKKKQTALEKLLAKQERGTGPDPARKKSRNETDEDREIAWLEAKLGNEGRLHKDEFGEDGLDELFEGMGDLEGAAFGTSKKNYAQLLRDNADDLDLPSDFDPEELGSEDDFGLGADLEGDFDSEDEEAFGEFGVDNDELVDPSDDDDHGEMGELGSEESDEGGGMLRESDLEEDEDESDDEADEGDQRARMVRFAETEGGAEEPAAAPAADAAPSSGRYVPPHLRKAAAAAPSIDTPAPTLNAPPEDPRLRRQLNGHLNKLSAGNIGAIVDALLQLYGSNPRAVVSTTLTNLLLGIISDRDNLGDQLVITYAALVAALFRAIGIEFPAGLLTRAVELLDAALKKHADAEAGGAPVQGDDEGFEGRPGSKECLNLVAFLAELYNFQVVHCGLVYGLVRMFIEGGLGELHVELLSKIVKRCGQSLRQDDPSALKEIISLVKQKMQGTDTSSMNSRTRFMIEQLTNLKNNKQKQTSEGAVDNYSNLKKYLVGLNKKRASGAAPDALRVSLDEIRSSASRGKWWLVGAAWSGDPLAEAAAAGASGLAFKTPEAQGDAELARLARKQGMNTDIRKSVFTVLMSSEDYVDACERLLQLGLSDVQQRDIARVLLQCCGNEKAYNPYYTLVGHRLCTKSHSFQITLQYCLWDFLRELGEKSVGGEELVKSIGDNASSSKVSDRRAANLAKFYAWCLGKEALSITILKPVPFASNRDQTLTFLRTLFLNLLIATQTPSPALVLPTTATRKDREAIERVFVKAAANGQLVKGLGYYLEAHGSELVQWATRRMGEREGKVVKFGVKVAAETLSVGGIVDVQ